MTGRARTRPDVRGSEERRLRQQLRDLQLPNLFGELDNAETGTAAIPEKQLLKHLRTAESIKVNEPAMFSRGQPSTSNFLTVLYYKVGRSHEARCENSQVLRAYPDNLTAHVNNLELVLKEKNLEQANNLVHRLKAGSFQSKQILEARADIAYCMSCLSPFFYPAAIKGYETVVSEGPGVVSDSLWVYALYQLAMLYNKMSNKNLQTEYSEPDSLCEWDLVTRLCRSLGVVIQSGDTVLAPRSWADLSVALQKMSCSYKVQFVLKWDDREFTSEQCIRQTVGQTEPHILEMAGRHARGLNKLSKAVDLLEEAVKLAPHRHVAWHHLGMINRQMWKRGCLEAREPSFAVEEYIPIFSVKHGNNDAGCETGLLCQGWRQPLTEVWTQICQSMEPPSVLSQINPSQEPWVDKPRWKKAQNPITKKRFDYLQEANYCFSKASEIFEDTNCRYLVELSRTYFSLGQTSQAMDCLHKADRLVTEGNYWQQVHSADAVYLYEQWGVQLEEQYGKHSEAWYQQLSSIKDKYKLSIENSLRAKIAPDIAFYALLNIIGDQLQQPEANTKRLQDELIELRLQMRQTSEIGPVLDQSDFEADEVRMFYQIERFIVNGQHCSAYMWFTILYHERDQTLPDTPSLIDADVTPEQYALQLARNAAQSCPSYATTIVKDILDCLLPYRGTGDEGQEQVDEDEGENQVADITIDTERRDSGIGIQSGNCRSDDEPCASESLESNDSCFAENCDRFPLESFPSSSVEDKSDLVLLVVDGKNFVTSKLKTYLTEHCGLNVFLAAVDPGSNVTDILPNQDIMDTVDKKCRPDKTRGVLVVTAEYVASPVFEHLVDRLMFDDIEQTVQPRPPFCLLLHSPGAAVPPKLNHIRQVAATYSAHQSEDEMKERLEQCVWAILGALIQCD